jgi:putative copper export protein
MRKFLRVIGWAFIACIIINAAVSTILLIVGFSDSVSAEVYDAVLPVCGGILIFMPLLVAALMLVIAVFPIRKRKKEAKA